jgi:hypothetical protein
LKNIPFLTMLETRHQGFAAGAKTGAAFENLFAGAEIVESMLDRTHGILFE